MFTSAEDAAAAASRELVVLREQIERNRNVIAQTTHDIQLERAHASSTQAACDQYEQELKQELHSILASLSRLEKMKDGPTVPAEALGKAQNLLEAKKQELLIAKREVTLLEGVLRIHGDTPGLRLRDQIRSLYPEIELVALGNTASRGASNNDNSNSQSNPTQLQHHQDHPDEMFDDHLGTPL